MSILVIGLSHHSSPLEVRERFAFPEDQMPETLHRLRARGVAEEAVILSTCNRVEIYAATRLDPAAAFNELRDFLVRFHDYHDPISDHLYTLDEPQSVEHLFRVACGLDSMVLGETEILGQLKKAYDLALRHQHTGGRLNRAFQRAFQVAKHIRSETSIQRGSVSVGSVAVELAEKIFATLKDRQVLVIGAGDTSEKTARALMSRGAAGVIVTSRTEAHSRALAESLGARAIAFEDWPVAFEQVDIAISSTASTRPILDRRILEPIMKLRRQRPLFLVDIAVPRDIDPAVNLLPNVYLYNIDDLQMIADDYLRQRKEEAARCEKIIRDKVVALLGPSNHAAGGGSVRPAFGA